MTAKSPAHSEVRYGRTQYTPAEAALCTGASVDLQRDWRRRGILPDVEEGHARYEITHLCRLFALKAFSEVGVGPKAPNIAVDANGLMDAKMAAGAAVRAMKNFLDIAVYSALPDDEAGRYVIVDGHGVCRAGSLTDYEGVRPERVSAGPVAIIFDCKAAAETLLSKLPRPYESALPKGESPALGESSETGGSIAQESGRRNP